MRQETSDRHQRQELDVYPTTAPKGRSPYGLYNMAGNVREWVVRDLEAPFLTD